MNLRYRFGLVSLCASLAVIATGCAGVGRPQPITSATTFQLTVTAPTTGAGTITSSPAGINCPGTCTASFAQGTQVTLTAVPGKNYFFGGWSGGCTGTGVCTVTINAAMSVTASFTQGTGITVTLAGKGTGTVTSSPAGINCSTAAGAICSATFQQGASVTLSESPSGTNTFGGWSGACTGTTTTCKVTVGANNNVTATFNSAVTGLQNINHIIFFAQENRSLDHYFGAMLPYWAKQGLHQTDGVTFDGLPQFNPGGVAPSIPGCQLTSDVASCTPDPTNLITSFSFHTLVLPSGKTGTVCEENQSPFWNEAHNDWDYTNPTDQPAENPPPLNGFVYTAAYDGRSNAFMDVNGVRAMGYFEDTDLNLDYALASTFGTSDRWFSPVMDRTQVNRAYMYAATSQGYAYPPGQGVGDNAPFTAKTIVEALQDAGITWKVYVDPTNASYNGVNCATAAAGQAQDMCLAGVSYISEFAYETQIQNASTGLWQHFAPVSQFAVDLADDATFPQFAMIEPASNAGLDEHPSDSDLFPVDVQLGAQYLQNTILNPFMQSPTWTDSVLILTYDEAGGLYDHVAPQPATPPGDFLSPFDLNPALNDICTGPGQLGNGTCTFGWTGYRVPVVVISPFSVPHFVSHTVRDTTAILKLVETRFGLSQLTNRDGTEAPMDEFFDFVNKPYATPPTLPTQSTSGICDQTPAASWNEPPEVTVTIKGSGTVSGSPASSLDACATECTGVFASGTAVTLTATPNTGSTFTGWTGGGCSGTGTCSVTVTSHDFVTATFNP